MFLFAFAVLGTQAATVATVDGTGYETLEAAIAAAEPVDGVVTYEICGKAEVSATGWIQVLKSGLSNVKKVAFVGKTEDAEICIAGDLAILADQQYDIDVSFRNLKLSKPNPEYGGDYGHSTNYFTTWLRNTGAAENTVTYENCTFPNGACNNQYGKTVYKNCTFANGTTGLYNLWIYGGSVEMDGGEFTGTRGMKVYTEGTPATAPSVKVKGTAFSGLTEKAAIVVSKAATVEFAEISVADCPKGLFQKDIEGSSDDQKVTVTANGSKISGSFAITANKEPETAKTEFNITGGMFTAEVPSDYCADGFTVKATTDADGNTVYGVVGAAATIADEKALRGAFFAAPTDGTVVTVTLGADITLETLYAAENFGTEKLDDNADGDTFNRYKVGVHPTAEDPNHWNPLVTGQTQEHRLVYGAYYHMSATDERIARLVVKSGQKIVLDLNGHTIQKNARAPHGDWSEVCTDIIGNYGTLEIVDSSTGTKGTVKGIGYYSCKGAVLHNYKDATMTVKGVNIDGNAAGMAKGTGQYVVANDGGTLTIDGANVFDTATTADASLVVNTAGTVTITGNATLNHPTTKTVNVKGGVVNVESATIISDTYAIYAKSGTVNVNGLTVSGSGTLAVDGNTATITKKPGVELSAPAGFTWVENDGVQVLKSFVAKVGETAYVTIAEACAALSAENHTLTLLKDAAWDATTPVYWAAGTQSGYAATLTEALTAAYKADAGAITVVCRPGADVGTMTHGHVADDLTIYGNGAYLSGGECDLEVDTYTFSRATGAQAADGVCLDKDITITAYELDNLGVWGERHTTHKVTVNLTDCDGKALEGETNVQRVYISGTTGVNDITLTDCDFLTKATAVYSNADGAIKAVNCSFTDGQVPFNINHKANGTQTVAVENCTFTNCGDVGDWKQFAAPLRLVNSGTGTQSAEVTGCAFAGTVGANGDILLGDGRTGQASNDVELKVVNTAANIQAQKPGYYGGETVDATKMNTATSPAEGTLETSVAKLLPVDPRTLGYATSGKAEALPATPDMNGEVVDVTAAQAQYVLDGAYGPIDGKTINFTESINDTLILGRASKYDGSKTVYRHGSHAGEALSYADFIAYKNQSGWTQSCYYERTVENVTFTANEGVTVKNFEADGGAHIYAGTAPVYDYVRDTGSWVTEGSCYFKRAILKNITFKGLTFKAKTDINTSESTTVYDGFTFKDCTFDLGTTADEIGRAHV